MASNWPRQTMCSGFGRQPRLLMCGEVATVTCLDRRPAVVGSEEADPAVPSLDQVPAKITRAAEVVRRDHRHVGVTEFVFLQEQHGGGQLAKLLDVTGAHRRRAGEEHDRAVNPSLVQREEKLLDRILLPRGLDQECVPLIAEDVAEPRHEQIGHRVGEKARRVVEDQEPERVRTCRAQAARGRVRVVAELLHHRSECATASRVSSDWCAR